MRNRQDYDATPYRVTWANKSGVVLRQKTYSDEGAARAALSARFKGSVHSAVLERMELGSIGSALCWSGVRMDGRLRRATDR